VLARTPPYLFLSMIVVPIATGFTFHVCACVAGGPLAQNPDGSQSSYTDVWATHHLLKWITAASIVGFLVAQSGKAIGVLSSKLGSLLTILVFAFWAIASYCKLVAAKGDRQMLKGFLFSSFLAAAFAIVANQYVMKSISKEIHLCVLWFVWNVCGELCLGYFRLCVRRLDLTKCDTHTCFLLSTVCCATINGNKRIPLLCLTDPMYITVMIFACFLVEVLNRITVVKRDEFFDRCVRRQTLEAALEWKDSLHRQVYIHNEMLQEIFELIYPLPLGIIMYVIQFSPTGEPIGFATIAVNCLLQILIEFFADACAIYYGSKYQSKFYRVASTNMWNPFRFKMLCIMITSSTFCVNGFFFYTYLRVGETPSGDFITLM